MSASPAGWPFSPAGWPRSCRQVLSPGPDGRPAGLGPPTTRAHAPALDPRDPVRSSLSKHLCIALLLISGGGHDLQRLLILMIALREIPHATMCKVRHRCMQCILLSSSTVLPCVPLDIQMGHRPPCNSYRRPAMLALACLTKMVHRRVLTAWPSPWLSPTFCGCLGL